MSAGTCQGPWERGQKAMVKEDNGGNDSNKHNRVRVVDRQRTAVIEILVGS